MQKYVPRRLAAIWLLPLTLACGPQGTALYAGPAKPSTEVATVNVDLEMQEIEGIVSATGQRLDAPRQPHGSLLLTPGRYTILLRTPERISACKPLGASFWRLPVELSAGHTYATSVGARVTEVFVDREGSGCAQAATIGSVQLDEPSTKTTVATGEAIPEDAMRQLLAGKSGRTALTEPASAPASGPESAPAPAMAAPELANAPDSDPASPASSAPQADSKPSGAPEPTAVMFRGMAGCAGMTATASFSYDRSAKKISSFEITHSCKQVPSSGGGSVSWKAGMDADVSAKGDFSFESDGVHVTGHIKNGKANGGIGEQVAVQCKGEKFLKNCTRWRAAAEKAP